MVRVRGGRYELLEVIGSGGMGTVWKARDRQLDRLVALKGAHPLGPGDPRRDRLLREARFAASVSHPNLVEVYDVGIDDEGPFLVMQFVDAMSLAEVGSQLGRREILESGAQVALALAAIHRAGIVHRDVKPQNVLLAPGGAKLVDFGVARAVEGMAGFEPTVPGVILGTRGYIAPEVRRGEPASAGSDVFGIGLVMAELLLGPTSANGGSTVLPEGGPEPLARLLAACTADDAADRPDAEAVARALAGLASDEGATNSSVGDAGPATAALSARASQHAATGTLAPERPAIETTLVALQDPGPHRGRPSGTPLSPVGLAALVLLTLAAGAVLATIATRGGEPGEAALPPATASTAITTATTISGAEPADGIDGDGDLVPPIPGGDSEVNEQVAHDALADLVGGSERNDDAIEKVAEKVSEASEALAEGERAEARRKLDEALGHARQDLDGDAQPTAISAIESWADQLGLPLE